MIGNGAVARAFATTASSSMGLREQVEYTSLPPGGSSATARARISAWVKREFKLPWSKAGLLKSSRIRTSRLSIKNSLSLHLGGVEAAALLRRPGGQGAGEPPQHAIPCRAAPVFTEMCSGSEAGSYLRLTDFVYH